MILTIEQRFDLIGAKLGLNKVNFFFAGFPKSGSTLFWNMLKAHPEIHTSELKEINFFNSDHIKIIRERVGKHYTELVSTEREYEALFTDPDARFNGDFNPTYIYSKDAPQRIYNYNKNAKIILSIREPVSYIRSTHFQNLYNLAEEEVDLLTAFGLEGKRKAGKEIPELCVLPFFLYYSELICYQKYIENFVKHFPINQIKLILFDDIIDNKLSVYKDLLQFIGVHDVEFFPPEPDRNPSHALRFQFLRRLISHPGINKTLMTFIPKKMLPLGVKISHKLFKKGSSLNSMGK
jgi:hypothetical protein